MPWISRRLYWVLAMAVKTTEAYELGLRQNLSGAEVETLMHQGVGVFEFYTRLMLRHLPKR